MTQIRVQQIIRQFLSAPTVSRELAQQFRRWFSGNGHLEEKYAALQNSMEELVVFERNPSIEVYASWQKIARMLHFEQKPRTLYRRTIMKVAAVIIPAAILLGGALYLIRSANETPVLAETIQLAVPAGEKKYTMLPDYSDVWINGNSELKYTGDFEQERVVHMEGEAFFSVSKQDGKPFRVVSDKLSVTVLGTVFNIDSGNDSEITVVSLYEGRLNVDIPGDSRLLDAGQELKYNALTGDIRVTEMFRTKPEWMRNIIDFNQRPATEVLQSIGRIYGYNIHSLPFDDVVTLKFEGGIDFEDVMGIMSEMSGFDYRIDDKDVYITKIP